MEWYYVWWPWLISKCVTRVCQHQLCFLFEHFSGQLHIAICNSSVRVCIYIALSNSTEVQEMLIYGSVLLPTSNSNREQRWRIFFPKRSGWNLNEKGLNAWNGCGLTAWYILCRSKLGLSSGRCLTRADKLTGRSVRTHNGLLRC